MGEEVGRALRRARLARGLTLRQVGERSLGAFKPTAVAGYERGERAISLKRFYAATYTHNGVYTQSVRFVSGNFGYTVFTRAKGMQTIAAGVEVRDGKSGKTSIVSCSERPRFYIDELKGLVACDAETPVGTACIR